MKYMKFLENHTDIPICPHCRKDLDHIPYKKSQNMMPPHRKVYFCPHCRRVLGFEVSPS
jgi:uncharacterized protein with PIN domain